MRDCVVSPDWCAKLHAPIRANRLLLDDAESKMDDTGRLDHFH